MPREKWITQVGIDPALPGILALYYTTALHLHLPLIQLFTKYKYFLPLFWSCVIFPIIKSKAKSFQFNVNLYLIQRDDFFRAIMNRFTSYMEHAGEEES